MKFFIVIAIILLTLIGLGWILTPQDLVPGSVSTTTSTISAQNSLENTPPATAPDLSDQVVIDSPKSGASVEKKFTVQGKARGNWYFEASLPVQVLDKDGKQLWIAPAQAQGEWMTAEFVPFSVSADVGSYTGPATLVVAKDNPSGLPEHDASISIPIVIK